MTDRPVRTAEEIVADLTNVIDGLLAGTMNPAEAREITEHVNAEVRSLETGLREARTGGEATKVATEPPVSIGRSAAHHRLSALAQDVPAEHGTYTVLTGDFDSAANRADRGRDPEWFVKREGDGIVYRSPLAEDVAEYLVELT